MPNVRDVLVEEISKLRDKYSIRGVVDSYGNVYPLGADTKVLSTVFELISRPAIYAAGKILGYTVKEPDVQNHYPDFTLYKDDDVLGKIAIDVKTTYRKQENGKFHYTLGGYTGFIRRGNELKNIVFPFDEYSQHWVVGYVYSRIVRLNNIKHRYTINELGRIPLSFGDVQFFV